MECNNINTKVLNTQIVVSYRCHTIRYITRINSNRFDIWTWVLWLCVCKIILLMYSSGYYGHWLSSVCPLFACATHCLTCMHAMRAWVLWSQFMWTCAYFIHKRLWNSRQVTRCNAPPPPLSIPTNSDNCDWEWAKYLVIGYAATITVVVVVANTTPLKHARMHAPNKCGV